MGTFGVYRLNPISTGNPSRESKPANCTVMVELSQKAVVRLLVTVTLLTLVPLSAQGALLSRTITIDGQMSDWDGIRDNPGQFTEDPEGSVDPADRDYLVQATGRDLKKFSVTWDQSNLYFYIERYASTSNQTDWWFYLDLDNDRMLEDGEYVLQVNWQGSNRRTGRSLWRYDAVDNILGDPIEDPATGLVDGYKMPGSINSRNDLQGNLRGGSSSGLEMESYLSWSDLGFAGPGALSFHIASSNGSNLPTQVDDNMDGPGNNALVFTDLALSKSVAPPSTTSGRVVTYNLTLTNAGINDVFAPEVLDNLVAAGLTYVADNSATTGTTYDPATGRWTLGMLAAGASVTLELQATATPPSLPQVYTNVATIATGIADDDITNDSAQAAVTFSEGAQVSVAKSLVTVRNGVTGTSNPKGIPGAWLDYTLEVTNAGGEAAGNVVIIDRLPAQTSLFVGDLDGQGAPIEFIDGDGSGGSLSGLTFTFASLGSTADDVDFSANGGLDGYSYVPQPDAQGFDAAVTTVRITPQGSLGTAGGGVAPRARFRLRVVLE